MLTFMPSIQACDLPEAALLRKYLHQGAFADCYVAEIAGAVTHCEYVEAFYTTKVFKVERLLLGWLVSRPSTDLQAKQLASGALDVFAAWSVEDRRSDQLLLSDFAGRTKSWLMVARSFAGVGLPNSTRLYFGSAVVVGARSGKATLGMSFRLLLGFHKLYSRVLLFAAKLRIVDRRAT
jgi:hypothetical protein